MGRMDQLRTVVDSVLVSQEDSRLRISGFVHLYGVSALGAQLALRRGLNPEVASAAGMLHDIYTYRTGLTVNHAHNSEEDARPILRDLGLFTAEEQRLIRKAIFRHSIKATTHESYDEVLKDADVLQRYLHNADEPVEPAAYQRLQRVAAELGLPQPQCLAATQQISRPVGGNSRARRLALADIAEELARRPLIGNASKSGPDVYPLLRYFPGATISQGFDWCASFAYHCCMQTGLSLPIRYPALTYRYAAVPGWLEWAKLPQISFFHAADENEFIPERGDLVIFDQLVSDVVHDHMGIVLAYQRGILTTAEGNVQNRSGIFRRDASQQINGYIRIDDAYSYHADDMEPVHIA